MGAFRFLFLFSFLIFLVGCQTVQVKIPIPSRGMLTFFELQDPNIQDKIWDVRVVYPEASNVETDELVLSFHRKKDINSDFPYFIGWDSQNRLKIEKALLLSNSDTKGVLEISLVRNLSKLPAYKPPSRVLYVAQEKYLSSVRLVRPILDGKRIKGYSYCNAVRVGENLILTNNHCLDSQTQCNNLKAYFSGEKKSSIHQCSRLIETDSISDQSLFEIETEPSDLFPIATIEDTEYYYPKDSLVALVSRFEILSMQKKTWKIKDGTNQITSSACRVTDTITFAKSKTRVETSTTELTLINDLTVNSYKLDCEAQHGQSGSPVYNLHGNLIGVLWGKSEDDSDVPYSLFASISPRIREALFKAKLEGLQASAP